MSEIVKETAEYVEMSDSITLSIVKDGAAGTSINMKTGVTSTGDLPETGASVGDSYIIDGHLWTYTGATTSDDTHHNGFTDCGQVSGEAGKNNYVHVAWCNVAKPTKEDEIALSNTDGAAYAYMGTWVSETKEDDKTEAKNMATWVYVKGDKGDDGSTYDIYLSASVLKGDSTGKLNDSDRVPVTAKLVRVTGGTATQVTSTDEAYFTISRTETGGDIVSYSRGNVSEFTVEKFDAWGSYVKTWNFSLYVGGVFLKTVTLPVIRDGANGNGTAATVYTIEPCANFEATGRLTDDASKIEVSIKGDVLVYKKTGDEPKKVYDVVSPYWFVLTVGDTNYVGYKGKDSSAPFDSYTSSARIAISKTLDYPISTDTNNIPGSATLTVYDGSVSLSDNTVSTTANQLASLVVPISLNPGAIQDINNKLGTIQQTTTSKLDDMNTTIETIKQGQGEISLKVSRLSSRGNILAGGNVAGTYSKKYEVWRSEAFTMEQGKTYTVTARIWMEPSSNGHFMRLFVFGADDSWSTSYSSDTYTNTSASVVRFKFEAGVTKEMVVGLYEQGGSTGDAFDGVHIDWCRVDEGDWTGDEVLDQWSPAASEVDALNLLPDPDFSEAIAYSDYMGERNSYNGSVGAKVDAMAKDSAKDEDGCYGVTFERSGSTDNHYEGLVYYVPYRGAGTYFLSFCVKDLSQTVSGKAAMDEVVWMQCYTANANKEQSRNGIGCGMQNTSSDNSGAYRVTKVYTFDDDTDIVDHADGTHSTDKIAYLEVRLFLSKNGCVRVSRLCLSKSDHYTYWNAAAVSAERKKELDQLATGIDIKNHKILITSDNVKVRNNKGEETTAVDAQGNLSAGSLTCKDKVSGTVMSIMNGFFSALKGKAGVSLGVDKNGYPCLIGTDPNGNVLWRLGQTYETADQDSKVTMEVVSMKAYGQMNSYAIGEGVILTLNVTNNTNVAITINTSNMHMSLKSEFGNYRGNVDVATKIAVGATAQVVLRGTNAIDTSSSSSTYTTPVGRSVTAVVIYQGDMRLMQDAEYQEMEGLRKDSEGNVQYTLPLM